MEGMGVSTRGGLVLFSTGIGVSLASLAADALLSSSGSHTAQSGRLVLSLQHDNALGILAFAARDASLPECALPPRQPERLSPDKKTLSMGG